MVCVEAVRIDNVRVCFNRCENHKSSNGDKMQKSIFFMTLSLVLATGCAKNSTTETSHSRELDSIQFYNDKVLNCVVESGHHVYEKDTACPVGGETFKSLKLGTHSTYGRHLDWEPISYMRFPIPIPVCPGNGFVIGESEYSTEKIEALKAVVQSEKYRELYNQKHATYFLYAKTLEFTGKESENQWWLYLNASWEADNCGDKTRYIEYADLVIAASKDKLAGLSPDVEEYWVLSIIIPNMYRRIGDFDKAQEHLNMVGIPTLKNPESNEFFSLAKKLLASAIANKIIKRVAIKEDENV